MRIHDLEYQQAELLALITQAVETKAVKLDTPTLSDFLDLADEATERQLDNAELAELTRLVQQVIELPMYSTRQAAAWLGMSYSGVQYAIYQNKLHALQPGRDLVFLHQELERYAAERRYSLD